MFETSSDVRRHEKALELHSLLELHDKSHFRECEKEMFLSYPSVLNRVGGGGQAVECSCPMCTSQRLQTQDLEDLTTSRAVFSQLPNDGRRSPRSALFCHMATEPAHSLGNPHVYGLSGAAVRSSSYIETQDDDETAYVNQHHHFDALSSDSDVNDFLDGCHGCGNDLYSDLGYDEKCKVMRELHDGLRPRAAVLTDLGYTPEDRAEQLLERINHWSSDADANDADGLHEYAIAHFAASGSSHCATLNARISAVEDQYLSAEATDEAADDMSIALQRLREGIAEYEEIVRNVSRRCIPIMCYSAISCALSIVKSTPLSRLVHTSAYKVLIKQKQPHCTLISQNQRPNTVQRRFHYLPYEAHGRKLPPHHPATSQVAIHCSCKTSV